MFCDGCGAQLSTNQSFCSSCGKPVHPGNPAANYSGSSVSSAGTMAARPRVVEHGKILGIFWLIYSVLHLLPGLFLIGFSHTMRDFLPSDVPIFVPGILHFVGLGLSLFSILGVIAGWGLLTWKPWARMLSIVLGVIHLLSFPLGTA